MYDKRIHKNQRVSEHAHNKGPGSRSTSCIESATALSDSKPKKICSQYMVQQMIISLSQVAHHVLLCVDNYSFRCVIWKFSLSYIH